MPVVRYRQLLLSVPYPLYEKIASLRRDYPGPSWTASEHDFVLHILERGLPLVERDLQRFLAPSLVLPRTPDVPIASLGSSPPSGS